MRSAMVRAIGFFCFWLMIASHAIADIPIGLAATAAATWTSLRLLPPGNIRVNPLALARMALRFPLQAIATGTDVARRALDPALPLRPGFVIYPVGLPQGPIRSTFALLTSLLPGTLPSGTDRSGAFHIHCLDTSQPVMAQLRGEEARLAGALGQVAGDD
jgi:multicomponent Na+:H+ antiporter subunit E